MLPPSLKKNTVASFLAQSRGQEGTPGNLSSTHPELTIEPIYQTEGSGESSFDQSQGGRRMSTYVDSDGVLRTKNVSESPETGNFPGSLSGPGSEAGDFRAQGDSDSEDQLNHDDGKKMLYHLLQYSRFPYALFRS